MRELVALYDSIAIIGETDDAHTTNDLTFYHSFLDLFPRYSNDNQNTKNKELSLLHLLRKEQSEKNSSQISNLFCSSKIRCEVIFLMLIDSINYFISRHTLSLSVL